MEVNATKAFNLGVEWRGMRGTGDVLGAGTAGNTAAFIGSGGAGSTTNPGGYNILDGLTTVNSEELFRLLSRVVFPWVSSAAALPLAALPFLARSRHSGIQADQEVSILSTPQIMTLDNEEAEINVGEMFPT